MARGAATVPPPVDREQVFYSIPCSSGNQQLAHRRTDVGSPKANGFCSGFILPFTVKEEFFVVAFQKTLYDSVAQMEADLGAYLTFYNHERTSQPAPHVVATERLTVLYGVQL